MKKIRGLFSIAVVGLAAFSLVGFAKNNNELANDRKVIEEAVSNSDPVKKELLEKIINANNSPYVEYFSVSSDDGTIAYTKIDGWDENKDIGITGRLSDNRADVFLSREGYGISIDTSKGLYYESFNKKADQESDQLSIGEINAIGFIESNRQVEKIAGGYKATIDDGLNYGYDLYDENGHLYESHLSNSEGNFSEILVKRTDEVEEVYKQLLELKDNLTRTEDIADIK